MQTIIEQKTRSFFPLIIFTVGLYCTSMLSVPLFAAESRAVTDSCLNSSSFNSGKRASSERTLQHLASADQVLPREPVNPAQSRLSDTERKRTAQRSRTARRFEIRGDYVSALTIYEQLHTDNPADPNFFDGIIRTLTALGRYDEAVMRLEKRIETESGVSNPASLYAELGAVHHQAGRENQAEIAWRQALDAVPGSAGSYLALSQVFIRLRLVDRAVEVLRNGRVELNDPDLFSMNLATFLQSRMDWKGAAEEHLRTLREKSSSKSYVMRSLANFPDSEIANEAVGSVIRQHLEATEKSEPWQGFRIALHEILAAQRMKNGDYDGAVEILGAIAKEEKQPWKRLVEFAGDARSEGALDAAEKALKMAAGNTSNPVERGSVDLAIAGIAIERGQYGKADSLLTFYCNEEANRAVEVQARLLRGLLHLEELNDPENALTDFDVLIKRRDLPDIDHARYARAVALARLDRLKDADLQLADVGKEKRRRSSRGRRHPAPGGNYLNIEADAVFLRARIAWWLGNQELTGRLLDSLVAEPYGADAENDAFAFLRLLDEGAGESTGLAELAEADKAEFNKRYHQARTLYRELAEDTASFAAPEAAWQAAQLELAVFPEDSAHALHLFVERFPDHPRAEEAWLELGGWWEKKENTEEAVSCYETLLINYPEGLLSAEARLRLDRLSGRQLPPLLPEPSLEAP